MIILIHNLVDGSLELKVPCDFNAYQSIKVKPTENSHSKQFNRIKLCWLILEVQKTFSENIRTAF